MQHGPSVAVSSELSSRSKKVCKSENSGRLESSWLQKQNNPHLAMRVALH
jgi:hypothetical protein